MLGTKVASSKLVLLVQPVCSGPALVLYKTLAISAHGGFANTVFFDNSAEMQLCLLHRDLATNCNRLGIGL